MRVWRFSGQVATEKAPRGLAVDVDRSFARRPDREEPPPPSTCGAGERRDQGAIVTRAALVAIQLAGGALGPGMTRAAM